MLKRLKILPCAHDKGKTLHEIQRCYAKDNPDIVCCFYNDRESCDEHCERCLEQHIIFVWEEIKWDEINYLS